MLDLRKLNAVATDLDLEVHTAKELDHPVRRAVAYSVTSAIGADRLAVDGHIHKAVFVQISVGISTGKTVASNDELAHDARGHEALLWIHDKGTGIADRYADWHAIDTFFVGWDLVDGTEGGILSGTIGIDEVTLDNALCLGGIARVEAITSSE